MSFVDLMANDIWSSSDIDNKVQALIRNRLSAEDELKASRLARKLNVTQDEIDFIDSVDLIITQAINEGRQARYDMSLLLEVLRFEEVDRRLNKCEIEPEYDEGKLINRDEIDRDIQEREDAEETLNNMEVDVRELFTRRNPPKN